MPRPRTPIDLGRLEELAAPRSDGRQLTQKEIAARLGVPLSTLQYRLTSDAEARDALGRGRARASRPGAATDAAPPPDVEAPPGRPSTLGARIRAFDAIGRGARTVGKLLSVTRLDHTVLTIALQDLAQMGRVFVRTVGGERQYFIAGEILPPPVREGDVTANA
jgi:hypothetical protein